jgi:hypothetical protein
LCSDDHSERSSARLVCILELGFGEDALSEPRIYILRIQQIYISAAAEFGKLVLNLLKHYQPWPVSGIVFDEKIEIAVRPQFASHSGTEEREASDMMPPAETLKSRMVEDD